MTTTRNVILLVVALPFGVCLGFLSLEGIGVPLVAIAVLLALGIGRRSWILPATAMSFGLGFAATVVYFALRTSGIFAGAADTGTIAWFAFWFLFACALVCVGAVTLRRHRVRGRAGVL